MIVDYLNLEYINKKLIISGLIQRSNDKIVSVCIVDDINNLSYEVEEPDKIIIYTQNKTKPEWKFFFYSTTTAVEEFQKLNGFIIDIYKKNKTSKISSE